jgi:hypothetical protein
MRSSVLRKPNNLTFANLTKLPPLEVQLGCAVVYCANLT